MSGSSILAGLLVAALLTIGIHGSADEAVKGKEKTPADFHAGHAEFFDGHAKEAKGRGDEALANSFSKAAAAQRKISEGHHKGDETIKEGGWLDFERARRHIHGMVGDTEGARIFANPDFHKEQKVTGAKDVKHKNPDFHKEQKVTGAEDVKHKNPDFHKEQKVTGAKDVKHKNPSFQHEREITGGKGGKHENPSYRHERETTKGGGTHGHQHRQ